MCTARSLPSGEGISVQGSLCPGRPPRGLTDTREIITPHQTSFGGGKNTNSKKNIGRRLQALVTTLCSQIVRNARTLYHR